MKHINYSKLIDELGGSAEVARICYVSSQAVSKWKRDGIPKARLMFLVLARPDIFSKPEWIHLRGSATPKPEFPAESDKPRVLSCSAKNVLVIEPTGRKEDRREGERRNGDRRRNSNGGGRRVSERRAHDRRVNDRRK